MRTLFLLSLLFSAPVFALTVTSSTTLKFVKGFAGDGTSTLAATAPTAGSFTLSGTPLRIITITFPPSVALTFSSTTMNATNFTQSPATFRLSATGTGTVQIGARRAAVPASAPPGLYVGSGAFTFVEQGTGNTTAGALSIEAPIWRAMTLSVNRDLDFGAGAVGDGTKIVLPSAPTAGVVDVAGEPGGTFTYTFPASVTMLCTPGCGGTAAQRQLTATLSAAPASPTALDATGAAQLRFGGTRAAITTGKRQGTYSATFTVTVAYN